MKFRCERDALVEQLSTASRAVSSRGGALPVLTGIHLRADKETLTMTGSDLEITVRASVPVAVTEPGEAVLPSRIAVDIIRSLDSGAIESEEKTADEESEEKPADEESEEVLVEDSE